MKKIFTDKDWDDLNFHHTYIWQIDFDKDKLALGITYHCHDKKKYLGLAPAVIEFQKVFSAQYNIKQTKKKWDQSRIEWEIAQLKRFAYSDTWRYNIGKNSHQKLRDYHRYVIELENPKDSQIEVIALGLTLRLLKKPSRRI